MPGRRRSQEIIHEGRYAAEVFIDLKYSEASWSPTMSAADAQKLETVRLALRRNDVAEAREARTRLRACANPGVTAAAGAPREDNVKAPRSYTGKFQGPVLPKAASGKRRKSGPSEAE